MGAGTPEVGIRNGPYNADFPVGTTVIVMPRPVLERFVDRRDLHHSLTAEQLECAESSAVVRSVGYYHGSDELYELEGLPGIWREE